MIHTTNMIKKITMTLALVACCATTVFAANNYAITFKYSNGTLCSINDAKVYIQEGNNWTLIYENRWTGQVNLTDQAVGKKIKITYVKRGKNRTKYHVVNKKMMQYVIIEQ